MTTHNHASVPAPSDTASAAHNVPAPSDLVSLERKIHELAAPRPMYSPQHLHATYALRYDWTGWLTTGTHFPPSTRETILHTAAAWHDDGLELGEVHLAPDRVQMLFDATPRVNPTLFCARVKGRLQHALRAAGTPVVFSRKIAFRSLGENLRQTVEGYLRKQVRKEQFADPRYAARMQTCTVTRDAIDLAQPVATHSGRYWYNLHLVFVVSGRARLADFGMLTAIRDHTLHIADRKGFRLKSVSVMPDHLHLALGGDIARSPEEIALSFLNNLAYLMGRNRIWQDGYYAGTFSEYGMEAVRRQAEISLRPATQGRRGANTR